MRRTLVGALWLLGGCLSASYAPIDRDGDGFSVADGDCDDGAADLHPGAVEVWYDGIDQDCDGDDDDADGDGYGVEVDCWDDPDAPPPEGVTGAGWAPLSAADVNPGATETWYDGIDADCAGDDDFDADADGYQSDEAPQIDGALGDDCDDADGSIHPLASEIWYDGVDQDCDGNDADADGDGYDADEECDDADPMRYPNGAEDTWYDCVDSDCDGNDGDQDGDGFVPDSYAEACDWTAFSAHVAAGDCWDDVDVVLDLPAPGYAALDPGEVYPGAADVWYDGIDADCAGDDDFDADADGYQSDGALQEGDAVGQDCDDADPGINPEAEEDCATAVDDNCDGLLDSQGALGCALFYRDDDRDGYGDQGLAPRCYCGSYDVYDAASGDDCDDADGAVNPGSQEICNDLDDDCDGAVDPPDAVDAATWYADDDGDGYGDARAAEVSCERPDGYLADNSDCDDGDDAAYPGAAEEDSLSACMRDGDGDGYGDASAAGAVSPGSDCDDGDGASSPAATEYCDGEDRDCDGDVDESGAADAQTWYADGDGDGYGDGGDGAPACERPDGYVADDGDCDDGDGDAYPGAGEYCDGHDDDCDGDADESGALDTFTWYADGDGDGYGDAQLTSVACDQPDGYVLSDDDCDDDDGDAYPGAVEADDQVDDDCDEWIDEDYVSAGDVLFSELMAIPDSSDGQWLELYNTTKRDVALDGWRLSFAGGDLYVSPDASLVIEAESRLVFCYASDAPATRGAGCDYVWGQDIGWGSSLYGAVWVGAGLDPEADALSLEVGGLEIDALSYDARFPFDEENVSGELIEGGDNDSAGDWCAASSAYDDGYYGTPGADNDCAP